ERGVKHPLPPAKPGAGALRRPERREPAPVGHDRVRGGEPAAGVQPEPEPDPDRLDPEVRDLPGRDERPPQEGQYRQACEDERQIAAQGGGVYLLGDCADHAAVPPSVSSWRTFSRSSGGVLSSSSYR